MSENRLGVDHFFGTFSAHQPKLKLTQTALWRWVFFCQIWKQLFNFLDEFLDLFRVFGGVLEYMVTIATSFQYFLEVTSRNNELVQVTFSIFPMCKQDNCFFPDSPAKKSLQVL